MNWPMLRLVWETSGHKMETISNALKEKWPKGYSVTNLQRLTSEPSAQVPEDVAALVMTLPIEKGFEELAEVVRAGLAAAKGNPKLDLDALASKLADKLLPRIAPQVIAKAIEALASEVRELSSDVREVASNVRELSRKVDGHAKRVDRERKEGNGELRTELRRMVWTLGALTVAVGLLQVACQYAARSAKPGDSAHTRGGGAVGEIAQGGQWNPFGFLAHVVDGETGERKQGRPMPHQPLPHQALAPCQGSASTLYGGCWMPTLFKAPCPPDQYQEGNACYIPLGADPNVPVGGPEKRQRGEEEPSGDRSHGDMPGREEE